MAGVAIQVRHSIGDETEHRGTWTFDAPGGGPTYPAGGITYSPSMFGFTTLNTMRCDPIAIVAGVPYLLYHDYGLRKIQFWNPSTLAQIATGTNLAGIQVAFAAVGR